MVPAGRADIEFHAAWLLTAEGRTRRPPEAVEGAKDAHGTVGHRFRGETISTRKGSTAAMAGRSTPAPRRLSACLQPFGTADAAGQVFEWRGRDGSRSGAGQERFPGRWGLRGPLADGATRPAEGLKRTPVGFRSVPEDPSTVGPAPPRTRLPANPDTPTNPNRLRYPFPIPSSEAGGGFEKPYSPS